MTEAIQPETLARLRTALQTGAPWTDDTKIGSTGDDLFTRQPTLALFNSGVALTAAEVVLMYIDSALDRIDDEHSAEANAKYCAEGTCATCNMITTLRKLFP